jgi:hypothetical protein
MPSLGSNILGPSIPLQHSFSTHVRSPADRVERILSRQQHPSLRHRRRRHLRRLPRPATPDVRLGTMDNAQLAAIPQMRM